jgi:hypothetical protein
MQPIMLLGRWYWGAMRREARRLMERGYLLELDERRVDWALAGLTVEGESAAVAHLEALAGWLDGRGRRPVLPAPRRPAPGRLG